MYNYENTIRKNNEITKNLFINYLKEGGLPELLNFNNEEIKRHYVEDLRNTIVLRDIVQRNQLKDLTLLEDVFKFIMSNIGNLTSVNGIVKYFKSKQKKPITTHCQLTLDIYLTHSSFMKWSVSIYEENKYWEV